VRRGEVEIIDTGPMGQRDRQDRSLAALAAPRVEDVGDAAGAERAALEPEGDGARELRGPVVIK
jgi:hypothetical protein